jgi:Xaa-Pro aminopeptidase
MKTKKFAEIDERLFFHCSFDFLMPLEDKQKYARVQKMMKDAGLDALLVKLPENVLYFSNWWPITGWGFGLIFADADPIVFAPDSEMIFTSRRIVKDIREYAPNGNTGVIEQIQKLDCANKNLKIGIEGSFEGVACTHLGYELAIPNTPFFNQVRKAFPKWELVDAIPLITQMRSVKTQLDFENLKLVNELNAYGLNAAAEAIKDEMTEVHLASICESAINEKITDYQGKIDFARALAFVMGGPENGNRACWPYNISSAYKMKKGELCMIELNTQINGYWSDLTRTWVVSRNPSANQKDMMDTINGGINAALKVIKPGIATHNVDKASRDFIMKTKWGKYHTPFLGHGIGVKLHEPIPMLYPGSPGVLAEGNYFTVEPGIYGKEILGALRIERDVWLGPNGPIPTDLSPCEL